jgi:hypothetical protein
MGTAGIRVMIGSAFGIFVSPNVFSIGRCFPAPAVPPLRGGIWSFYIFSSGGGAHELGIGDFDFEFLQKLGVLAHLLA